MHSELLGALDLLSPTEQPACRKLGRKKVLRVSLQAACFKRSKASAGAMDKATLAAFSLQDPLARLVP
jgi:hypothetical protein